MKTQLLNHTSNEHIVVTDIPLFMDWRTDYLWKYQINFVEIHSGGQ